MHMASLLISKAVGTSMYGVTTANTVKSIKDIKITEDFKKKIPVAGAAGALVFAAQMLNFSIPGTGSSGHIVGGIFLSALLGPELGYLSILGILAIQCLFFGDGGLLALGCNVFNMGYLSCFVGYKLIYSRIVKNNKSKKNIFLGSILGSVISLEIGAFSVVLETMLSGKTDLSFGTFMLYMLPIHIAIGLVEGVLTALSLSIINERTPQLLYGEVKKLERKFNKKAAAVLVSIALVFGGVFSLFASSNPDGLEWSMEKTLDGRELAEGDNFLDRIQNSVQILPDYSFENSDSVLGTSVSGVSGVVFTLLILSSGAFVLSKKSEKLGAKI